MGTFFVAFEKLMSVHLFKKLFATEKSYYYVYVLNITTSVFMAFLLLLLQ